MRRRKSSVASEGSLDSGVMENVALASTKLPVLGPTGLSDRRRRPPYPFLPVLAQRRGGARAAGRAGFPVAAFGRGSGDEASRSAPKTVLEKLGMQDFASMSSSSGNTMFAASGNPQPLVPPPSSTIGSPLFWIGVGVGLSALFSMVAARVKSYMMQQALKTMMGQMTPQNGQFNNAPNFSGSFPFPAASQASPTASQQMQTPVASQPVVTVDVAATEVKKTPTEASDNNEPTGDPEKYAFVDVSPSEELQNDPYLNSEKSREASSMKDIHLEKEVSPNGVAVKKDVDAFHEQSQSRKSESVLSVEALEKMMEDPTVQKMVYPYLPEEMRNPATFKLMLQNPQYRQQLHDMLNNMGGSSEWDNRMMESMKNLDLSSPEVKQQFEQIGLTPEEVISKVMANPEIAMAFQNPKVQAAIMDCSQNPLSIAKYQNDQEVMDVFKKISEIFPGVTGYP